MRALKFKTGSTMLRNLPQREEYLKKKRKIRRIKYGIFFGLLILIVGLLSYLSHINKVRVSEVALVGGILVTEGDVKKETLNFIQGKYFWLFPKNNTFFIRTSVLEKHLADTFKRIKTIGSTREGTNKIQIKITEREPIALWCREAKNVEATSTEVVKGLKAEECYFIDSNSVIFATAPNFSGDAYFKYYGLVEKEMPIGEKYIASSTEFIVINKFINALKDLKMTPLNLISKESNEFSIVLYGGGEIMFDATKSLETAYNNLDSLLKSSEFSSPNALSNLDYIDLRYGNKLFYRLK
jgi:hypothetical protein